MIKIDWNGWVKMSRDLNDEGLEERGREREERCERNGRERERGIKYFGKRWRQN